MAAKKRRKKEESIMEAEIDLKPLADAFADGLRVFGKGIASVIPTQKKRLSKAEKKYERLKAKIEAIKQEKELKVKIAELRKEEEKLKGGG